VDLPRAPRHHRRLGWLAISGAAAAIGAATISLTRLRDATPSIDRSALVIGTVERGPLVRSVLGHGTLVPEEVQWVVAVSPARAKRVLSRVGAAVSADDVLVELDNPDLELAALDAERQLASAEADLLNIGVTLESGQLAQGAAVASLRGDLAPAERRDLAGDALQGGGVLSRFDREDANDKHRSLAARLVFEEERLAVLGRGRSVLVAAQRTQVARLRDIVAFRRGQIGALRVRASASGVVQEMRIEPGQWVTPGTLIARVARGDRLKAEIRVAETQAGEIRVGETVRIDAHAGLADGHVTHVDPAVQNGSIRVDVAIDGGLPGAARPDLSIDAVIDLERLDDVLHIARPSFAQPGRATSLFRIDRRGDEAARVRVELGRASVLDVEIKSGLAEGDRVILSDTTAHDAADRLRLR
jgi:HlyD family secretion protein